MKRITKLILALLLVSVSACTKKDNPAVADTSSAGFTAYLDQMLIDVFSEDSFSINFSFENPEAYGIKQGLYTVGFTTQDGYNEWISYSQQAIKDLGEFKDSELTLQQQIDRDALVDYYTKEAALKDYYEYETGNSNLGSLLSTNAQLSVYLDVFALRTKLDIEGYLNMMTTLPAYFQNYVDLEKQRQANGTGYSQDELNAIIEQAQTTVDSLNDSYFLIQSFDQRISETTGITESEKEAFKVKNKAALLNEYKQAYQLLVDQLKLISGSAEIKTLADKPGGKAYFEALLQRETGSSKTVKETKSYITKKQRTLLTQLQKIMVTHPDYINMIGNETYPAFSGSEAMIASLIKTVNDSGNFPKTSEFSYEIRKVDASMEASSSPAFYFTPTVDYQKTEKQFIYINGDYSDSLYSTMAHEGFPGHMYQFNYFRTLDAHPIRSVLTQSSNAEGWAVYAENYATSYMTGDESYTEFSQLYMQLLGLYWAEFDIGVNYDGWTLAEFTTQFEDLYGSQDGSKVKEQYLHLVANPTNTTMYYISNVYVYDLKQTMKTELKDKYSDLIFHTEFLKEGSTSFDVIEKYLNLYISENKE